MRDNQIVLEGNLTRDVELQFGKTSSKAYTRNAVAVERRFKNGDDWESETSFFDFTILDERLAENFCDTFSKGDRVIIVGDIRQRTVEGDDGEKKTFYGVVADNVGASVRWATASITRNPKGGSAASAPNDDLF